MRSFQSVALSCFAAVLVGFLCTIGVGCAYLESPAAQPLDAIAVAVAVDTVVGTNSVTQAARAHAVKDIAQQVLAFDGGVMSDLASLNATVSAKVAALKLPPGDQAAAQLFLAVVNVTIQQYITAHGGDANVKNVQIAVSTVAAWVIQEATRLGG